VGETERAIAEFEEGARCSNRNAYGLAMLGHCLARSGQPDRARAVMQEMLIIERERYVSSYDVATVLVGLGETAGALARLEQGYKERSHWMALLKVDPRMDPLREEPGFKRLLERMGFPE
jgi:hypothetical protein